MAGTTRKHPRKPSLPQSQASRLKGATTSSTATAKRKPGGPDKELARVWWPPTEDSERTGFSGMYWPVQVHRRSGHKVEVEYDNGEREWVHAENVAPDVPVPFGGETEPIQVGEFVEVSNNSKSDPAAWIARVIKVGKRAITVEYPFHDSPDEPHKPELVRRALVWDDHSGRWNYLRPGQDWENGEVTSPTELEQCRNEKELMRALQRLNNPDSPAAPAAKAQQQQHSAAAGSKPKAVAAAGPPLVGPFGERMRASWQSLDRSGGPTAKKQKLGPQSAPAFPSRAVWGATQPALPRLAPSAPKGLPAASATASEPAAVGLLPKPSPPRPHITLDTSIDPRGVLRLVGASVHDPPPATVTVHGPNGPLCYVLAPGQSVAVPASSRRNENLAHALVLRQRSLDAARANGGGLPASSPPPVAVGVAAATPASAIKAPRVAMTEFAVFSSRHRARVKAQYPELDSKAVTAKLRQLMTAADAAERQTCQRLAAEDERRYEREMAAFGVPVSSPPVSPKPKAVVKRGRSAYILFAMDYRKNLPAGERDPTAASTAAVAAAWQDAKAKDPDSLKPYIEAARREAEQVARERAAAESQPRSSTAGASAPAATAGPLASTPPRLANGAAAAEADGPTASEETQSLAGDAADVNAGSALKATESTSGAVPPGLL